jgi:hypothetical protein
MHPDIGAESPARIPPRSERPMADSAPTTMEVYPTCTVVSALPPGGLNLRDELYSYQTWLVDQALMRTNGNRAAAARLLGIKRTTLVMMLRSGAPKSLGPRRPGPMPPSSMMCVNSLSGEPIEECESLEAAAPR